MNFNVLLFSSTLLLFGISIGSCYLPVICIPGILDVTYSMLRVCDEIKRLHPGTAVHFIQAGTALISTLGMWEQISAYKTMLEPIFAMYSGGVHVVAHSQGTLISRAIIETTGNHPVKNFLSVAGPFMGQYGISFTDANFIGLNVNNMAREDVYKIAYNQLSQRLVSVAGYWNDPTQQKLFLEQSTFLPHVNNLVAHPDRNRFKKNFLRLKNLILFGGDGEEVIIPWQSELGGYYDEKLNIVPMKEQHIYKNDTFGLRTLDERGGLTLVDMPKIEHLEFVTDLNNIKNYYLKYLY